MNLNILLVAEEAAGVQVLRALQGSGHCIRAVATTAEPDGSRAASVFGVARQNALEVWPATCVAEPATAERVREAGIDLLLNVHSLRIVHPAVLNAPRIGAYNLHPSLLPRYAGLNSVSWALYQGETQHGVTLHRMSPRIDAGSIAYQRAFAIEEREGALAVFLRCVRTGVELVMQLVATAAQDPGAIPDHPQPAGGREFFRRAAIPDEGRIVWTHTAKRIVNFVRACDFGPFPSPWGHPRFATCGRTITLHRARRTHQPSQLEPGTVEADDAAGIRVACGDESILIEDCRGGDGIPVSAFGVGSRLEDGERVLAA
jgi:methionyl-tRNA formyltransferase